MQAMYWPEVKLPAVEPLEAELPEAEMRLEAAPKTPPATAEVYPQRVPPAEYESAAAGRDSRVRRNSRIRS